MIKFSKISTDNDSEIYIAYFDQNPEISIDGFSVEELEKLSTITAFARKREYIATRALLRTILPGEKIIYSLKGSPMLESGSKFISISHSSKAVAIMVSFNRCGIDIELLNRNFERASSKFLTPRDFKTSNHTELAAVWSAKEAIYKYFGGDVRNYEDAIVTSISDRSIICMVLDSHIEAKIVICGEHIVVYCDKFTLN